jgi:hypothetical protein
VLLLKRYILRIDEKVFSANYNTQVQYFLQAWTYGLDGQLVKATRITGIQNFNVNVCCEIPIVAITF